jgi:DNA modification methylase
MSLSIESPSRIENVDRDPMRLRPWAANPRLHSKKQIDQLAKSIKTFGFTAPVIIDETESILAGHGRVLAAQKLGLRQIPCRRLSGLSEVKKRALVLADNKLALNATWDETLLALEIEGIRNLDITFDVTVTGFSPPEIDLLVEAGKPVERDGDPEDDLLPQETDAPAVTTAGDTWLCGEHRIICGDSLAEATYQALLGLEQAEMVFTDPPYNLRARAIGGMGAIKHRDFVMAAGEMSQAEFTGFLTTICRHLAAWSADGSIHFIAMDWRHLPEILAAGEANYAELKNLIVWVKDNGGMGSFYRSRHELFLAFKNGTAPHINNFELGQHGRSRSNVWQYRGVNTIGAARMEELALHPTVKPVQLVADAMRDCSGRGGIVLDAFGGSGSTMIAAEKTRRRARLIEIDPVYVDRSVRRWEMFAKDDAVLAETGESFAEVAARRVSASSVGGGAA